MFPSILTELFRVTERSVSNNCAAFQTEVDAELSAYVQRSHPIHGAGRHDTCSRSPFVDGPRRTQMKKKIAAALAVSMALLVGPALAEERHDRDIHHHYVVHHEHHNIVRHIIHHIVRHHDDVK